MNENFIFIFNKSTVLLIGTSQYVMCDVCNVCMCMYNCVCVCVTVSANAADQPEQVLIANGESWELQGLIVVDFNVD